MFGLGTTELIVIGVIVFLIFGAKRIPEIGKGLGGAVKEFRQIKKDVGGEEGTKTTGENGGVRKENEPPSLENIVARKAFDRVPGVRQVRNVKNKVDRVKKIVG
jgi:sec-independent protein translocase protein TatA